MAKLTRRKFLKSTVALGAGALLYRYNDGSYKMVLGAPRANVYELRVIHTNDHHAHVEPQSIDAITIRKAQGTTPASTRLFGGLARRKTLFDQYRAESVGKNILFLDAGDVFQGTLFFNLYQGQADLDFYIDLGYDAMTIGNHEFDKGPQPLVDFVKGVKGSGGAITKPNTIPMVSANITATDAVLAPALKTGEPVPGAQIGQFTIKTIGTKKVGIFGLTTPETKVSSSPGPGIDFGDPITVATTLVPQIKLAGADYVIALTHIGYELDKQLAAQVAGIDLVVGGHSHSKLLPADTTSIGTFAGLAPEGTLTPDGPYPTIITGVGGKQVPVITDWEWGKWIGDISLGFDATGAVSVISGTVHPVYGDPSQPAVAGEPAPVAKDAGFAPRIAAYAQAVNALNAQKIGAIDFTLNGGSSFRKSESTGGNLIADAMLARVQNFPFSDGKKATIAITNSGGVRASIPKGDVTVGNVLTVLPFGNTLATVDLTGAQVIAALENGVSQVEGNGGRFPQVAGIRFTWSRFGTAALQLNEVPNRPAVKGSRIVSVEILNPDGTYTPINKTATYRIVTNNFMLTGGDGYFVFTKGGDKSDPSIGGGTNQLDTGLILADVVQDYIATGSQNGAKPLAAPKGSRSFAVQVVLPLVAQLAAVPAQ